MREIRLDGYVDEESFWGDEFTPKQVREALYGAKNEQTDDVRILLNSYGGSVNAAMQIYDEIRRYPGTVTVTVSGIAASAATVLATAADRLEMGPGAIWMIHDPSMIACGNIRDMGKAMQTLMTYKEAILNVYERRNVDRTAAAQWMEEEHWMDAGEALRSGFIDGITDEETNGKPTNTARPHTIDRMEAEKKVKAWVERQTQARARDEPDGKVLEEKTPESARERRIRLRLMKLKER